MDSSAFYGADWLLTHATVVDTRTFLRPISPRPLHPVDFGVQRVLTLAYICSAA